MMIRQVLPCLLMFAGLAQAQIERVWLSCRRNEPTHVTVNWETSQPGESVVECGPTAACDQRRVVGEL